MFARKAYQRIIFSFDSTFSNTNFGFYILLCLQDYRFYNKIIILLMVYKCSAKHTDRDEIWKSIKG